MSASPLFTVFSPTYNRAHTIHRVFDSLCAQTSRDFEWLVVDDGSTDNTEELIANWARTADFPVRYFKQEHSGKHIAHNLAVQQARGWFIATVDSDDALVPTSLRRIGGIWNDIPTSEQQSFSGIGGLCCDQYGATIGDCFPTSPFDSNLKEVVYRHRIRGEKWGVTRTDVLRQYPFPDVAGTQFVPEGLIGLQMSRRYKRRYVNEVFRIYYRFEARERGKTLSSKSNLATSSPGRLYYYCWLLNQELDGFGRSPLPFFKAAVMLPIVARRSGQSLRGVFASLTHFPAKCLVALGLPLGYMLDISRRICAITGCGGRT